MIFLLRHRPAISIIRWACDYHPSWRDVKLVAFFGSQSSSTRRVCLKSRLDYPRAAKRRRLMRGLGCVLALLLGAAPVGARQTAAGRISGSVFDPEGLPVAGASVSATNEGTGLRL